jgi:hypothetical protein
MKTIDDGIRTIKALYDKRLPLFSKDQKDQLNNELEEFKNSVEGKSIIEQQQLFYEKFGQFLKIDHLEQKNKYLKAINNKLTFFVVIAIISIIVSLLSL